MPDINEEILFELKKLSVKLYGENGFEGDVPEIKVGLKDHNQRIRRIEIVIASILGSGVLGGGVVGLVNLLN